MTCERSRLNLIILFNSIQSNADVCTRQLLNFRAGSHDEQK